MKHRKIFGFGSLLSTSSLKTTVPDAFNVKPAYIQGFIREFNFWDSLGFTETELDVAGIPFCAVDVKATPDKNMRVNGVVFTVGEMYFDRLLKREEGYGLVSVPAYDFFSSEELGEVLVFSACKDNGTYDFSSDAQRRYLKKCLAGASQYGTEFYNEFLQTTFINGKALGTLLPQIEKSHTKV